MVDLQGGYMFKKIKRFIWMYKFMKNYVDFDYAPMFRFMEWHTGNMIKEFEGKEILNNQHKRAREIKIFNELVGRFNEEDYGFWDEEESMFKDPLNSTRKVCVKRYKIKEEENWEMLLRYLSKARRWWI